MEIGNIKNYLEEIEKRLTNSKFLRVLLFDSI